MGTKLVGVESLSERQKEILRLVARHFQAKEIARILKISESTVKTHTDEARRRLNVGTSRQAARLLLSFEHGEGLPLKGGPSPMTIPRDGDQMPNLDHETDLSPQRQLSSDQFDGSGDRLEDAMRPLQDTAYRGFASDGTAAQQELRPGKSGLHDGSGGRLVDGRWDWFRRRLKDLPAIQLLGLIIGIAILLAFVVGSLVAALLGIIEVVHKISTYAGW